MTDNQPRLSYLERDGRPRLAYRSRPGAAPALMFLPGYASDMDGAKANALDAFAAQRGPAMLRFDYSGTGSSEGAFEEGTVAGWIADALAVIDLIGGPVILVGSSMGAWVALHVALHLPDRVKALVGIASAPDFTEWGFTAEEKSALHRDGLLFRPSPYGEPLLTTLAFWQSGQQLRLLDGPIAIDTPVRLIHGDADEVVPVDIAMRLMRRVRSADVQLTILKGGGHRLSEPHEIDAVTRTVAALVEPET